MQNNFIRKNEEVGLAKLHPQYELGSRWSSRSCTGVMPFDYLCSVAPAHPAASYLGLDGAGLYQLAVRYPLTDRQI